MIDNKDQMIIQTEHNKQNSCIKDSPASSTVRSYELLADVYRTAAAEPDSRSQRASCYSVLTRQLNGEGGK
jgi:hypothetical protein